jgi:four helix bundle protein
MFLQLDHFGFEIFRKSKMLVLETYKVSKNFPSDEKFTLTQQIRRAAISVHLNVSEGFSRKSQSERKRFFEVSRGSLIELDTAIDISLELLYVKDVELGTLGTCIISCFSQLSALIKSLE